MRKVNLDNGTPDVPENTAMVVTPDWPVYTDRRYKLTDCLYMIGLRQIVFSQTGIHIDKQERKKN